MGVNIKNIKSVMHYGLPRSATDYVQEIGRCGRGGQPGNAILLRSKTEIHGPCYRKITDDEVDVINFFFGDTRCI